MILILGFGVAVFVYRSEPKTHPDHIVHNSTLAKFPFKLGLDLSGGSHLVYKADVSQLEPGGVKDAMDALRDVIERRVNLFGVSEPVVQVQQGSFSAAGEQRLIVDLPGVTDVNKAIELIGQTPLLEFKVEKAASDKKPQEITTSVDKNGQVVLPPVNPLDNYESTGLTGRYLKRATLEFDQNTRQPVIGLQFDDQGSALFAKITKENVGKVLAIFLDGSPISAPVVREEITGGTAQISGSFTPEEAKLLVGRLNSGALPVPISLVSTQTIGPTLGAQAVDAGVKAALIGFLVIAIFLTLWYRLPGFIAVLALCLYISIMLALFKLIPVTLTAAGIAGFIISIGFAVDANVLIFERIKEEIKNGRTIIDAMHTGFARAWTSIRDSNTSSIITALILFWFGTSLIQGFALTFGLGVLVSMLSAISISRLFLYALGIKSHNKVTEFFFGSGFSSARAKNPTS